MAKSSIVPHRVIFKRVAPDRLHVVIDAGTGALFGLVFFLPGLALMLIGFHVVPISGEDFMYNGVPVLGLFGVPFFLVGGALICWRRWLTFDLSRRTLIHRSGLLAPMFRRERNLQEFAAVTIAYQIQTSSGGEGGSSSSEYYPVILTAGHGADLSFNNGVTYQEAFAHASTLAEFLGVPVRDVSTDHPLEIAPADLAHPWQARLRDAAPPQPLTPPPALRSQVEDSPGGVRLTIPVQTNTGLLYGMILLFFVPAALVFLFMTPAFSRSNPAMLLFMAVGMVLVLGTSVFGMLKHDLLARRASTVVSIDSQGIRIEERRGRRTRASVMLPLADLIDLDYGLVEDRRRPRSSPTILRKALGSKGITLKTKTGLYPLGAGLPDDEVEYLALVVTAALAPRPTK